MSQRNLADSRETGIVQKQPLNVYTVMLIVAFFAISIACLLLYLELKRWGSFPWWKAQTGGSTAYIYQTESPELVSPIRLV
ncbi:MAG: hypothetical protein ACYC6N_15765 [Pirellulaceae bacterium]